MLLKLLIEKIVRDELKELELSEQESQVYNIKQFRDEPEIKDYICQLFNDNKGTISIELIKNLENGPLAGLIKTKGKTQVIAAFKDLWNKGYITGDSKTRRYIWNNSIKHCSTVRN